MNPAPSKTPASMIEDGYSIDLVPWWKYLWQRFNPWHPWPKEEIKWIPVGPAMFGMENSHVAVLYSDKTVCTFTRDELLLHSHRFQSATHYCPLPPLP